MACTLTAYQAQAQTPSASSNLVAQPIPDRTVTYSTADPGVAKPIIWGMDGGGWTNSLIWLTGVNYLGASNLRITRVPAFATDTLKGNVLQQRQKDLVKERLDMAAVAGHSLQIMLNPGGDAIAWYSRDAVGYARYALLMELTKQYIESFGHTVVCVTGYNEPDPGYAGISKQNFYDLIAACKARPGLSNLRFCGGNTLDPDVALDWYNYSKPAGLNEGNTHQLAGTFDKYANFYQTVRANGHYASDDEAHNIMEGIVGAQYGLQAGVYWGYASLARGEFSQACNGQRLGYAEHRPNWTAAAVYRKTDNQLRAFGGASERQAATTVFSYVAKDRDVYYEGYGPQREYSLVMPGGYGYGVDQPNAERVVNITWGEDIQPAIKGRYILVNRNSGKVMEVPGGSTANGVALQQNTYSGGTNQQWNVTPMSSRTGGDFSYFTITAAYSGKAAELLNYSLTDGGSITTADSVNSGNQHYYFDYAGDGYFYIRNRHSSKYLDIQGASTSSGGGIVQMASNGGIDQQWRFIPVGAAVEFSAPSAPTGVVATANAESVQLNWTASPQSDVAGYTVFRAEAASGPFNTIARNVPGNSFLDNTATINGQYYYKIRAVDKSLNRSAYSNQVSATTTGTKDLVARLSFDGNTLDTSINGNRSATYGGTSYTSGKVGSGSIVLNGTNAFVQLPATLANQAEITIATWVYLNGSNAWQRIFDFGNDQSQYLFLTPTSGNNTLRFAIKNGGAEQLLEAPALPTGQWAHVAVTLGTTGARLYVNGAQAAQSTTVTIRPLDFKPVLNYLGRSQYNDPLLNGRLDEFRVYNYALSPIEVATLANPTGYYQVQNRATGLYLDGVGRTTNGDNASQYASTTHPNSYWALREIGAGYYQIQNKNTGMFLDGLGRTTDGSAAVQWANTTDPNAQWAVEQFDGNFYRLRNRTTNLYLDGVGRTVNGSDVAQYANTTSTNAQWSFPNPVAARTATALAASSAAEAPKAVLFYPNPVSDVLHVRLAQAGEGNQARILNSIGQLLRSVPLTGADSQLNVSDLPSGLYLIEVQTKAETTRSRFLKE